MKTRICLFFVLLIYPSMIHAQSASDIHDYIDQYKQIALEQEEQYGIPASITLAQGILESAAGKSILAISANNHFGIKALGEWGGPVFLAWDDEQQKSRFRSYSSALDSFKDHSILLKNSSRYRRLFTKSVYDYRGWAVELQNAGYATAENYAKALIGYIDAYRLYEINGGVKLKAGKKVVVTKIVDSKSVEFDSDCVMDDTEKSEEEIETTKIIGRFADEINGVRCTVMYPGEDLSSISVKYDIPLIKILKYNEIPDKSCMHEGDLVFLQKKKNKYSGIQDSYRVRANDTLYEISQQFGLKVDRLAKMNAMDRHSCLKEGERLNLK